MSFGNDRNTRDQNARNITSYRSQTLSLDSALSTGIETLQHSSAHVAKKSYNYNSYNELRIMTRNAQSNANYAAQTFFTSSIPIAGQIYEPNQNVNLTSLQQSMENRLSKIRPVSS